MDAAKGIDISIEQVPSQTTNCWKIIIKGYLDADTAGQLMSESMVLTRRKSVKVIVDLEEVTFMDGAGWDALLQIAEELIKTKGKIVIFNMTPTVERIYKLLNLESDLLSFPTEADALHHLG